MRCLCLFGSELIGQMYRIHARFRGRNSFQRSDGVATRHRGVTEEICALRRARRIVGPRANSRRVPVRQPPACLRHPPQGPANQLPPISTRLRRTPMGGRRRLRSAHRAHRHRPALIKASPCAPNPLALSAGRFQDDSFSSAAYSMECPILKRRLPRLKSSILCVQVRSLCKSVLQWQVPSLCLLRNSNPRLLHFQPTPDHQGVRERSYGLTRLETARSYFQAREHCPAMHSMTACQAILRR